MRLAAVLVTALLLAGCNNSCQRVCVRMKTFAEDCGFQVSDAELDACLDEQSTASKDDRAICKDFGDAGTIERTWDCEVVADYWGAPAGS